MTGQGNPATEWKLQEILSILNEVSPEEWVCHIHSRLDDREETYLESNFSTLFTHRNETWKASIVRERYDSEQPLGSVDLIREDYWMRLQSLQPRGVEQAVLSGVPARRLFNVMRERCRPFLVDEVVTLELSLEGEDEGAKGVPNSDSSSLAQLVEALAQLPPSQWKIHYLQRGGAIDFCQKRMTAQTDRLRVAIGENFIPAVDAATEAAGFIPHYELELRTVDGIQVAHSLTQAEIEELYAQSKQQIAKALRP